MKNHTVTFFGHKDTPKETEPTLRTTLLDLIENHNAVRFYVGNNGNFYIKPIHQITTSAVKVTRVSIVIP